MLPYLTVYNVAKIGGLKSNVVKNKASGNIFLAAL